MSGKQEKRSSYLPPTHPPTHPLTYLDEHGIDGLHREGIHEQEPIENKEADREGR